MSVVTDIEEYRRLLESYQRMAEARLRDEAAALAKLVADAQAAAEAAADSVVVDVHDEADGVVDEGLRLAEETADYLQGLGGAYVDEVVNDVDVDVTATRADSSKGIDDAVNGVKQWVLDRFSDIGIDLEEVLGGLGSAVGGALDGLSVTVGDIIDSTREAIETGLEGAGAALSSGLDTLTAEVGGILDAVGDALDPIVTGLNLGFGALLDGFKDMLSIDVDKILDAQATLQRRAVERQIRDVAPLGEAP